MIFLGFQTERLHLHSFNLLLDEKFSTYFHESMQADKKPFIPVQEYLKIERSANTKSEYFNGEIFAMAGATRNHQVICDNIIFTLKNQIKNKHCIIFGSDLRVKVNKAGLYTYPDISPKPALQATK